MTNWNYDPNQSWGTHDVEITFAMWDYRAKATVKIRGNCKGAGILEAAISTYADELHDQQGDLPEICLTKPAADGVGVDRLLHGLNEEDDTERELERMCIGLSILSFTPKVVEQKPAPEGRKDAE